MKKLYFIIFILLVAISIAATDSPYARRIRPFATAFPVSCVENEVGYDMTGHIFGICDNSGTYKTILTSGSGAPIGATYITQTANSSLTNEQALSLLSTGILKNTTTTGVLSIAVQGTDYSLLPTLSGQSGKFLTNNGSVTSWGTISSITNSAGANVVPKSDGTNLVASQASDNGTDFTIAAAGEIHLDAVRVYGSGFDFTSGVGSNIGGAGSPSKVGDYAGDGNSTLITVTDASKSISLSAATESFAIDGTAHTITNTAATSISNVTPLWGAGDNGTQFQINDAGAISKYRSVVPVDGGLLIGNTSAGEFRNGSLINGTGISITNGAGSITISHDNTNLGTILGIPINNTVLATATGTVYSSPGNDGTALSIATEGNVSFPITRAGTIRNLFIRTGGTAKTNTPTTVITIRKNGVDTAVTLTMTQTVNTTTSDITHGFTVVQGDLITVSFTTTGVAGVSTSIAGVSFELD